MIPQVALVIEYDSAQTAFHRCVFGVMAQMHLVKVFLQGPFTVEGLDSPLVQQLCLSHAKKRQPLYGESIIAVLNIERLI